MAGVNVGAGAETSMQLKRTSGLSAASPVGKPLSGPTHIEAESISGHNQREMVAEGKVIIRNLREQMEADWVRYDQPSDQVEARGNVVFSRDQDRLEGESLKLKLEARLGDMQAVRFQFAGKEGGKVRGGAQSLIFAGPDVYRMADATYTTCAPGNQDWELRMDDLRLDYLTSLGAARQVRVKFMDVPILYTPWMDFALDDRRKSGFLAPSYGASDARGLELKTPWYWNIAHNRDATLSPRLMSKRGLQLGGEFRYLESGYRGELIGEFLPNDQIADRNRHRVLLRHRQQFDARWSGALEYENVSDNSYFANLSDSVNQTSQVNLPRQISARYNGDWWQANGLAQSFQTLQDPSAVAVVEPYSRLPQVTLTASSDHFRSDRAGGRSDMRFDFNSELVYFDHPGGSRVQGARIHANPGLSIPLQTAYSVVTPRLGWYLSHYALDDATRTLSDSLALPAAGSFNDTTRSLPMFSLDSSLFLERDWSLFGRDITQTLEPRAYYVYIPYRDQTRIPVFDSSNRDLSLDQLFAENQYIGVDRINDANQLTLAVTSRFLEPDSGAERLQVTLGQRFYFSDQRVTLPGLAARSSKSTELLAQASGQINRYLRLNTGIQYDTGEGSLTKASLGGAWRYGPGRLVNADYRYTRGALAQGGLNQVDVSFQWPLAQKWYGLGRLNYSIKDTRLVEGLAGFEYNAGCWSLRGVMQQLATSQATATSAFFLQLELRGLTKLGPNPLDVLKRSITGYAQSSEISE
jgi:LPS-assembly protein